MEACIVWPGIRETEKAYQIFSSHIFFIIFTYFSLNGCSLWVSFHLLLTKDNHALFFKLKTQSFNSHSHSYKWFPSRLFLYIFILKFLMFQKGYEHCTKFVSHCSKILVWTISFINEMGVGGWGVEGWWHVLRILIQVSS